MSSSPLLKVEDLTVSFDGGLTRVVDQLNFSIDKGQCLGLVGESGSGKSLTALSIMQLLPSAARVSVNSKINFNGLDLLNFSERRMRKVRGKSIGMVFQDAMSAFNPVLTIEQQLLESINLHSKLNHHQSLSRAVELLSEVGIRDPKLCLQSYPHQLSGGMRQRAMLAMALASDSKLLIADEPTTALDVTIQAQILQLLQEMAKKRNLAILFISHDLAIVGKIADEIAVLQKGKKVEQAGCKEFFKNAQHPYSRKLLASILPRIARKECLNEQNPLLSVENLKVYFPIKKGIFHRAQGYVPAVDDVSFEIFSAETFALVGESGCGKTTTAKSIIKLLPVTEGEIIFSQIDISELNQADFRPYRTELQIIFQDPYSSLNPRMLVGDSLLEGVLTRKKMSRGEQSQLMDHLLTLVELPKFAKWRYPHEFSGGERQRLCLARALALEPKLLILDEPTSALDVSIQKQMLVLLDSLQTDLGLSYLLITHDMGVVAYLSHRMAVMKEGKIVEAGSTADVLRNPVNEYTKKLLAFNY